MESYNNYPTAVLLFLDIFFFVIEYRFELFFVKIIFVVLARQYFFI